MASDALEKMLAAERRRAESPDDGGEKAPTDAERSQRRGVDGARSWSASWPASASAWSRRSASPSGSARAPSRARGRWRRRSAGCPKLVTFEQVAAWAITEPDAGSDAFGGMKTTVRRDGDEYVLKGQKTFITNGPDADVIVVYAKLDEGDGAPIRGPQGADLRARQGHGGPRPGQGVQEDGDDVVPDRRAVLRRRPTRPRPAARRDRGPQPGRRPGVRPQQLRRGAGRRRRCSRSASSTSACGSASTTRSSASCGASRSPTSS